jgi:hypothetical protein
VLRPPITITCECGAVARVPHGTRWTCDACGRTWDTNQIPRDEYDALVRSTRLYGWLVMGPPLLLVAIFLPLTIFVGVQFAFLLFAFVLAYGLLVVPPLRRRANARVRANRPSWQLKPE